MQRLDIEGGYYQIERYPLVNSYQIKLYLDHLTHVITINQTLREAQYWMRRIEKKHTYSSRSRT